MIFSLPFFQSENPFLANGLVDPPNKRHGAQKIDPRLSEYTKYDRFIFSPFISLVSSNSVEKYLICEVFIPLSSFG